MPKANPSPAAVSSLDRRIQALELRKAGATYADIAKALGYSHRQSAHRAVQMALEETLTEAAEPLRQLEATRLDKLQRALWASALQGNHGAIDRVLRVMERRAKLLGLDAPVRQEVSGPDGEPTRIVIEYA